MKRLFALIFLIAIIYFMLDGHKPLNESHDMMEKNNNDHEESNQVVQEEQPRNFLGGEISGLMNESEQDIINKFGNPDRKDPSPFGYDWWVYENLGDFYIQIGVQNGKIHTIFATGNGLSIEPVKIGDSYDMISEIFPFNEEISFNLDTGKYKFKLKSDDMKLHPLVRLSDDMFVQFYFDTFTSELSSIRLVNSETLLKLQPYAIEYMGTLPKNPEITDSKWRMIEEARERQVFAITNTIRKRFNLSLLEWNEPVAEVASLHSQDMFTQEYFSHISLNGDGLKERLEKGSITYISAGENIAAFYPDAPSVVEGWLNSEGHRAVLLNENFTHLGTGVFKDYYTQNFLQK